VVLIVKISGRGAKECSFWLGWQDVVAALVGYESTVPCFEYSIEIFKEYNWKEDRNKYSL
jgi:hypothetical protein